MKKCGFSLIELLVVVAIIGVLTSVGVPQFRKFVMKARQAEAKAGLAGIRVAQTAFKGEFAVYGNRLEKLGVESTQTARYTIGFPDTTCADTPIAPDQATPSGRTLSAQNPLYYETNSPVKTAHRSAAVGAGVGKCGYGTVLPENGYVAVATGPIGPGATPQTALWPHEIPLGYSQDVWVLPSGNFAVGQTHTLINICDGTIYYKAPGLVPAPCTMPNYWDCAFGIDGPGGMMAN